MNYYLVLLNCLCESDSNMMHHMFGYIDEATSDKLDRQCKLP